MKKLSIIFSALFLWLLIFVACSDKDLPIEQSMQESIAELRSLGTDATHYYWFDGERIAITVNMDYVHAIISDEFREYAGSSSLFEIVHFDRDNDEQMQT